MQNIVKNTDCTNHIKELWKVFTKDGKELFSYTIRGEGEDEEECTKQLLAYENHCPHCGNVTIVREVKPDE